MLIIHKWIWVHWSIAKTKLSNLKLHFYDLLYSILLKFLSPESFSPILKWLECQTTRNENLTSYSKKLLIRLWWRRVEGVDQSLLICHCRSLRAHLQPSAGTPLFFSHFAHFPLPPPFVQWRTISAKMPFLLQWHFCNLQTVDSSPPLSILYPTLQLSSLLQPSLQVKK